ncbi:MAG: exodeoxyribonuclease III [Labilithrix sp.]|nr:exodeoxyribonuclease III [Labilithrix sp.]MCW5813118.1 exodeoxyribonuclease III [Labilithrix sp.]
MKIATWNVNGLRARHAQLLDWIAWEKPDVLCLQEIKATHAQIPDPLTTLHEYWNYWHGGPKGYSGVSLHLRRSTFPASPAFTHPAFDNEFRIVDALVAGVRYASVYVPNGGKDFAAKMDFLRHLEQWTAARRADGETLVVCGDLNVALTEADVHPSQVKPGQIGVRPDERALLRAAIDHGLVDLLRATYPIDASVYTWWPPWRGLREKNQGWRIDFILASEALAATTTSCVVRKEVLGSDHAPVVATF